VPGLESTRNLLPAPKGSPSTDLPYRSHPVCPSKTHGGACAYMSNRKERRLAIGALLTKKYNDITVINSLKITSLKTKNFLESINNLGINLSEKITIILPIWDLNLTYATRNLKNITLVRANNLNIKQLLLTKYIVMTVESLKIIEETYHV
jgi:large subunit ribosomal protein L4